MVITGLTRNQLYLTVPWVRIPPAPPDKKAVGFYACCFFIIQNGGKKSREMQKNALFCFLFKICFWFVAQFVSKKFNKNIDIAAQKDENKQMRFILYEKKERKDKKRLKKQ